jgi:glyoxylase-like metal-dependent hydrolase (beta-lactamase superfamily II)
VTILVGKSDVVVIDSGRTPSSALEVIEAIERLTPLPVRYLVNTHWHGDHQHGNATYAESYPGIRIVAHRRTREDIETLGARSLEGQIRLFSDRSVLERELASGLDPNGHTLAEAQRHRIRQLLSVPDTYRGELQSVRLTLPTLVFEREIVLHQDEREIRIFSNGAGNTRGDAVVYLPREKIVVTGDLLVATVPFMTMSYPHGWLERLDEIAALELDVLVPGHGPLQRDRSLLELHRDLLRSLAEQVDRTTEEGKSLDETVATIDLSRFRDAYSRGDSFLANEFDYRVARPAPRDAYLEATSAGAAKLAVDVATEASRLRGLVPESGNPEFLAKDLKAALDALADVATDVSKGRTYLALRKLSFYQDMVESSAFYLENQTAAFDELWTAVGEGLESEAKLEDLETRDAAVRAHAEIAQNRILPHYRAARLYAKAGQNDGGLFYLGSARAAAKRARLLAGFGDPPEGDRPGLSGLEAALAELSKLALASYSQGDAATTHHRDFIRMDAALKEARELLRDGRRYGAAGSLLEARLRLGLAGAPEESVPRFDEVSYRARLFDPNRDHSLARELWERALEGAASHDEDEERLAAVIIKDVIPFYFERIAE